MSEYGQFWPIGGGEGLSSSNLAPESNGVESKRAFSVPEPSSERYFGGGRPTRLYGSSTDLSGSDDSQGSARIVPQPSLTSSVSYNNLLNMPALEQPTRYLWVGALSQKASRPALCALMERFGPLEDVVTFPGRIYCFVTYQNVNAAIKCQQALQGIVLKDISADSGLVIKYRPERKASAHLSDAPSVGSGNDVEAVEPSPRIWLGNIAPTATAANLQTVLGRFGRLVDAAVFPARIGPLGYAFVKFERIEDAINAYNTLNNAVVPALSGTKQVKMRYKPVSEGAPPRDTTLDALQASIPSRHIWIGNVTQKPSEDVLIRIFSRYGAIESARVFSAKSYAFVNFFDVASAIEAITKLDGVSVPVLTGLKPLVMRYQHDANSGSGTGSGSSLGVGAVGGSNGLNAVNGMNGQNTLNAKVLELLNRSRVVPDSQHLTTPSESDVSVSDMSTSSTDPSKLSAILQNLAALNSSMMVVNGGGLNGSRPVNNGGLSTGPLDNVPLNSSNGMNMQNMNMQNMNTQNMNMQNMNMQNMNMQSHAMQSSLLWPSQQGTGAPSQQLLASLPQPDGSPSAFSPWI